MSVSNPPILVSKPSVSKKSEQQFRLIELGKAHPGQRANDDHCGPRCFKSAENKHGHTAVVD